MFLALDTLTEPACRCLQSFDISSPIVGSVCNLKVCARAPFWPIEEKSTGGILWCTKKIFLTLCWHIKGKSLPLIRAPYYRHPITMGTYRRLHSQSSVLHFKGWNLTSQWPSIFEDGVTQEYQQRNSTSSSAKFHKLLSTSSLYTTSSLQLWQGHQCEQKEFTSPNMEMVPRDHKKKKGNPIIKATQSFTKRRPRLPNWSTYQDQGSQKPQTAAEYLSKTSAS